MQAKIKIITGFRKDQYITIGADELHKAYYLFLNPEGRHIFNDGTAILGSDIREIKPDYNATMGWNDTYEIKPYDWEEIRNKGLKEKFNKLLKEAVSVAKYIIQGGREELLSRPYKDVRLSLSTQLQLTSKT